MKVTGAVLAGLLSTSVAAQDWQYGFTPYLWASSLDGTQTVAGRSFDVDAGFSDLVEFIDVGFAAHLEAQNDQWGWFTDAFYVKLSDEANLPQVALNGEVKQEIYEAGMSYRLNDSLEGLAGLRHQKSDIEIEARGIASIGTSESWTDGFVGLRWTPIDDGRWSLSFRGDVGAGDSDLVWLASVGVGYRFNDRFASFFGYRYLDTDYENDGFAWDIAQSGLGIGLEINW
jgi:predicted porin